MTMSTTLEPAMTHVPPAEQRSAASGSATPEPPAYDVPGPGAWTIDVDHQASPRGALMQEVFTSSFVEGTRDCFARYGLPLDRLDGRHVNGWFYVHPVVAGVPDSGRRPPPAPLLKVATRLIPELRRRRRTAAATIASRRWLADARTWATERERWLARGDALLAVDLTTLDDASLATHVEQALALATGMMRRHFELLGPAVAVGRLIVGCERVGLAPRDVIDALRGSSPATAASRRPLAELARITAGRPAVGSVAELRALSPRASELVDGYLARYGRRVLGTDVEAPCLADHPDQLLELVRAQQAEPEAPGDDPFAALVARVPEPERERIGSLLAEARECYASLDDNSGTTTWTGGVLRRAVLEVGRRAAQRGSVADRAHVFDLSVAELLDVAAGETPVAPDELARRRRRRDEAARHRPPPVLGGPVVEPPPPSVFPGPLAELAAGMGAYLDQKFTPRRPDGAVTNGARLQVADHEPVAGLGVVGGSATGRIVVSVDPADAIDRIEPGDILVCPYTTAAHNAIFPMLAGVVTQFGGPLGHTAVTAREFGIPAIVGTQLLPRHLDGTTGTLTSPDGR